MPTEVIGPLRAVVASAAPLVELGSRAELPAAHLRPLQTAPTEAAVSAVEALAEVLRRHLDGPCSICDNHDQPDHLAADLVAAIRSMPAEQVAELIDGSVERDGRLRYKDNVFVGRERVNGPWSPLGVSPETNGEQK